MIQKKFFFITLLLASFLLSDLFSLSLAQMMNLDVLRDQVMKQKKEMGNSESSNIISSFGSERRSEQSVLDIVGSGGLIGSSTGSMSYTVHVLGEVLRPGIYKVAPSNRVLNAIEMAGGFNVNASERFIQLKRVEKTKELDLFAYKYLADLSQNPYLMDNDIIFVSLKKGEVRIEGPVKRPGNYEMSSPFSLKALIALSGGFAAGRSMKEPIKIIRYGSDEAKHIIEVDNDESLMSRFIIRRGDVVIVPHVLIAEYDFDYNVQRIPGDNIFYPTINNNVYVMGAVAQPGPYPFQPSFSYNDYISQAGPTSQSRPKGSKIINGNGKKTSVRRAERINPGDTIIVPTKSITVSRTLEWFNTITSTTLTTILLHDRVRSFVDTN